MWRPVLLYLYIAKLGKPCSNVMCATSPAVLNEKRKKKKNCPRDFTLPPRPALHHVKSHFARSQGKTFPTYKYLTLSHFEIFGLSKPTRLITARAISHLWIYRRALSKALPAVGAHITKLCAPDQFPRAKLQRVGI